jgi:hypothetical protein
VCSELESSQSSGFHGKKNVPLLFCKIRENRNVYWHQNIVCTKEYCLLQYDTLSSGLSVWWNILPPYSGSAKKAVWRALSHSCLTYSSSLMMDAVCSSKVSINWPHYAASHSQIRYSSQPPPWQPQIQTVCTFHENTFPWSVQSTSHYGIRLTPPYSGRFLYWSFFPVFQHRQLR